MSDRTRRMGLLFSVLVIVLFSAMLFFSLKSPPRETESSIGFPHPYTPLAGQEVSFTQAQALVPYKISLPSIIGRYVSLKLEKATNTVTVVFASVRPADDADLFDVIEDNAIVFLEMPNSAGLEAVRQNFMDAINTTKNDVGGGLQPVLINGYFGCMGGNVEHTVAWCTEAAHYQLSANMEVPLQRLADIASSVPLE